jgi:hypothetical protein
MFQDILNAVRGRAARAWSAEEPRRILRFGVIGVLGVLAGGASSAAAPGNGPDNGKAQILRIEEALAAAQNAAQVTPYLDPHFVWDDVVPGEWEGLPAAQAHLAAEYGAVKNLHTRIVKISVDADDKLGFAYSIQQITWTAAASGQLVAFTTRQTDCYHRVGTSWLLVYQHVSFPVDLASGKAVLNESLSPKSAGF